MFPKQVLSLDQSLCVEGVTIMFSDITDSTRMYTRVGDTRALTAVKEHFEVVFAAVASHRGRVVKTIGDAVMATFLTPEDGLAAATKSILELDDLNKVRPADRPLFLKIGIHTGTCLAVALNGVNDLFGQTVNVAARVQGLAQSSEVIVTRATLPTAEHLLLRGPQADGADRAGGAGPQGRRRRRPNLPFPC